jgi:hypothetical protein
MFHLLAQTTPDTLLNFSQLGIAGLMGALWWYERKYSRQREDELTQAHQVVMQQHEHLQALLDALEQNTRVIASFTAVQQNLKEMIQAHLTPPTHP